MFLLKKSFKMIAHHIPTQCLICREPTPLTDKLCLACKHSLQKCQYNCLYCGLPMQMELQNLICVSCLQRKPIFDKCVSAFIYQHPLDGIIHMFKNNHLLQLKNFFAQAIVNTLIDTYQHQSWPQTVIPVPSSLKIFYKRGYNHTEILSELIIKKLSHTVRLHHAVGVFGCHKNFKQKTLNIQQRKVNAKHSFFLKKKWPHPIQHVAIFDDVVTTGETVKQLTHILKTQCQIQKVDIWCLARTPKSNHS